METPLEKELVRGEALGEGSGLFEHSAANTSELTPAPHGRKILPALKLWIFFVCFEMMQPDSLFCFAKLLKHCRKRHESGRSFCKWRSRHKCRTRGTRTTREVSQRIHMYLALNSTIYIKVLRFLRGKIWLSFTRDQRTTWQVLFALTNIYKHTWCHMSVISKHRP